MGRIRNGTINSRSIRFCYFKQCGKSCVPVTGDRLTACTRDARKKHSKQIPQRNSNPERLKPSGSEAGGDDSANLSVDLQAAHQMVHPAPATSPWKWLKDEAFVLFSIFCSSFFLCLSLFRLKQSILFKCGADHSSWSFVDIPVLIHNGGNCFVRASYFDLYDSFNRY